MGRECESEIFTYLFYIYCYFKCTFLSPCVKGKFSVLCLLYTAKHKNENFPLTHGLKKVIKINNKDVFD